MDTAKTKIRECIDLYIKLMPNEYEAFKLQMAERRKNMADEDFGQAADHGSDMRALFEMPESLHGLITNKLSLDELTWFKEGGADRKQGARWFANTFPVFKLPRKV